MLGDITSGREVSSMHSPDFLAALGLDKFLPRRPEQPLAMRLAELDCDNVPGEPPKEEVAWLPFRSPLSKTGDIGTALPVSTGFSTGLPKPRSGTERETIEKGALAEPRAGGRALAEPAAAERGGPAAEGRASTDARTAEGGEWERSRTSWIHTPV